MSGEEGNGNGRLSWEEAEQLRSKVQEQGEYQAEVRERFLAAFPFWRGDDYDPVAHLELMQEVRSARLLPEHIEFFLLVLGIEGVSNARAWEIYEAEFADRFRALEEKYGIDPDDEYDPAAAPEEYRALNAEYGQIDERTFVSVCREFGEYEIARLFLEERDELDRRREEGRTAVWGPMPSAEEMEGMMEKADRAMEPEVGDDGPEPDGV